MFRSRPAIITLTGILTLVVAFSIIASLLPDNSYLRYQLLRRTQQAEVQWIYERIHFDNRPIDVAIVGASTTQLGLSSTRMKERLSELGVTAEVVNFSVTYGGRDVVYAFVKEMFRAGRQPKLLVIGINERPAHFGHPAFKYLADSGDVLYSIYPVNLNYFSNLEYLPFRQMKLAAASFFPEAFGVDPRFSSDLYAAYQDYDPAISPRFFDGTPFVRREHNQPRGILEIAAADERVHAKPILTGPLADLEFGDEIFYIPKILELAKEHSTKVCFVYIPGFGGPPQPFRQEYYAHFGPVYDASFVSDNDHFYFELPHLNRDGALAVTDWLMDHISVADLKP